MENDAFVIQHTAVCHAPVVPEIRLHLATEVTPLWLASEVFLAQENIAPPFWAFAWPGSQALARYVLDHPEAVCGKHVIDFAAGSGLAGIACCKSGAKSVSAIDIDPLAATATRLNAALNTTHLQAHTGDIVGTVPKADVLMCGDVCYDRQMATTIFAWLREIAGHLTVILADPARHYAPKDGLEPLIAYDIPVSKELEDSNTRRTTLYRVLTR